MLGCLVSSSASRRLDFVNRSRPFYFRECFSESLSEEDRSSKAVDDLVAYMDEDGSPTVTVKELIDAASLGIAGAEHKLVLPRYLKRVIHAGEAGGDGGNEEMLLLEGVGQLLNLRSYRYTDAVEEATANLTNIR